jgi:hypothetical protein
MSNSFEDFVNNNLGIRMPLIEDNGHPHSSSKAAGILGSKYLDLNNNYLYEKTGEDNSSDWVKIASLGERRDVARGPNFSIQFNSGDVLAGNQYLTFLNNELSGVSGFFDELKVETIIADSMEVTGDLAVGGDFYASGEAFFGEEKPSLNRAVFSIQPSSLRGHNDAGQVRGGPQSSQANGNITIDITSTSPYFGKYSSLRMDFKKNGGSYSFSTSGNVLTINVPMLTGKGLSNARWYPNVGTVRDWLNTQVGVSAVLSSGVDPNKSGIQADGPGYIYPERAITKSIQSLGFHYDLVYSGEQLSGASGFFDDFKVSGDLAVGGNLYVSGETFIQSVTDVSVTGDISGYRLEGTSGVFDITTGASGIFDLTSGSSGDFDNLFVSGVSEITSGQFSKQLTISGMTVLTGIDDIRTKAGGPDYAIQYGSGTGFYGSSNLIYSGEQLSGASGFFDDFKVTGDLAVGGNLYVSGETFIQSVTDVSVTGDISGYRLEGTSGVFDITTGVSGIFDLTSGSSGDFDNLFVSGVSEITSGQFSEQLTISGMTVLTGVETGHFITTGETGIFVTTGQTGDFVTTGLTGDFVTTGLTGDFVTTGETGIFVTTGQTGDFVTTGLTGDFVTTGLTGDFVTTGETGIFVTTGQTGDFVTTGLTGDFVTTGETGIFVTTGQTGDFVTTGLTGDFVTTGETGIFVTTGQTGDFVTTGLTGDFVTTGETGIFVTTGQTGDFVTTGLTGDFVTTGETGSFINTGTVVEYISELKGSNSYSELEYNTSGDVTGLFTWSNDSQAYLVKTKKLTYNQSGLLTGVILTEGLLDVKLITELTYDSSGNLESIKKDYA